MAASFAEARNQLADALRQQAGIVTEILSDRTLRLRLETGDNDPIMPAHDFTDAPIEEVISYLKDTTGQGFNFRSALPQPLPGGGASGGARGGGYNPGAPPQLPADPAPALWPPELVGRSLTLHLDSAPVSRVTAQVLAALEKQAEIVAEARDYSPRLVDLKLSTSAAAKMTYSMQLANTPATQVFSYLRSLTEKTIANAAGQPARLGGPPVTLNLNAAPRTEAIRLLRDALEQQSGNILDEQPDGNFTARLIAPPAP